MALSRIGFPAPHSDFALDSRPDFGSALEVLMDNMDANRLNAERLLLILECTGQKIDDYLHGKHNSARVLGAALKTIRAELRIWRERGYKIDLPEVAAGYADFGSSKAFSSKPATDLVDGREPWNRDGRTQASVHPVS